MPLKLYAGDDVVDLKEGLRISHKVYINRVFRLHLVITGDDRLEDRVIVISGSEDVFKNNRIVLPEPEGDTPIQILLESKDEGLPEGKHEVHFFVDHLHNMLSLTLKAEEEGDEHITTPPETAPTTDTSPEDDDDDEEAALEDRTSAPRRPRERDKAGESPRRPEDPPRDPPPPEDLPPEPENPWMPLIRKWVGWLVVIVLVLGTLFIGTCTVVGAKIGSDLYEATKRGLSSNPTTEIATPPPPEDLKKDEPVTLESSPHITPVAPSDG